MKNASGKFRRGFCFFSLQFGGSWFDHMAADVVQRWTSWGQRSRSWRENEIHHDFSKYYYGVSASHASLRIILHEHVHVLMTLGYVDDTLLASSGSGVSLAVWDRDSGCWCLLLWMQSLRTIIVNEPCHVAGILRFRTSDILWWPEPAAISGNTAQLPHFLVSEVEYSINIIRSKENVS